MGTVVVDLASEAKRAATQRYVNAQGWRVDPKGDLVITLEGDLNVVVPHGAWAYVRWD